MNILVQYRESKKSADWNTKQIELSQAPSEGDHIALVAGGPAYRVETVIYQPMGAPYDAQVNAPLVKKGKFIADFG